MASVRTPLDTAEGVVDLTAVEAAASLDAEAVAMVTHEIVGALTPLQGWLSILATGVLDADPDVRREAIAVMKGAAGRLERLSRDLLDLSSLDAGGLRAEKRAVDVTAVVREVLKEFAGTAPDRSLQVSMPRRVPAVGDPLRIAQVLMNLLTNADRHGPPAAPIRVGANSIGSSVVVWVSDDGPAIDPRDRIRLFRPFARGRTDTPGGHGLGLAVSKRLVEAMGGRMGVVSVGGEGPSFFFTVPSAPGGSLRDPQ
jgi:signal transduction histidine kinase